MDDRRREFLKQLEELQRKRPSHLRPILPQAEIIDIKERLEKLKDLTPELQTERDKALCKQYRIDSDGHLFDTQNGAIVVNLEDSFDMILECHQGDNGHRPSKETVRYAKERGMCIPKKATELLITLCEKCGAKSVPTDGVENAELGGESAATDKQQLQSTPPESEEATGVRQINVIHTGGDGRKLVTVQEHLSQARSFMDIHYHGWRHFALNSAMVPAIFYERDNIYESRDPAEMSNEAKNKTPRQALEEKWFNLLDDASKSSRIADGEKVPFLACYNFLYSVFLQEIPAELMDALRGFVKDGYDYAVSANTDERLRWTHKMVDFILFLPAGSLTTDDTILLIECKAGKKDGAETQLRKNCDFFRRLCTYLGSTEASISRQAVLNVSEAVQYESVSGEASTSRAEGNNAAIAASVLKLLHVAAITVDNTDVHVWRPSKENAGSDVKIALPEGEGELLAWIMELLADGANICETWNVKERTFADLICLVVAQQNIVTKVVQRDVIQLMHSQKFRKFKEREAVVAKTQASPQTREEQSQEGSEGAGRLPVYQFPEPYFTEENIKLRENTMLYLSPQQAQLLYGCSMRVLLSGPPGTGKTELIQLRSLLEYEKGNDVIVCVGWKALCAKYVKFYEDSRQFTSKERVCCVDNKDVAARTFQKRGYQNVTLVLEQFSITGTIILDLVRLLSSNEEILFHRPISFLCDDVDRAYSFDATAIRELALVWICTEANNWFWQYHYLEYIGEDFDPVELKSVFRYTETMTSFLKSDRGLLDETMVFAGTNCAHSCPGLIIDVICADIVSSAPSQNICFVGGELYLLMNANVSSFQSAEELADRLRQSIKASMEDADNQHERFIRALFPSGISDFVDLNARIYDGVNRRGPSIALSLAQQAVEKFISKLETPQVRPSAQSHLRELGGANEPSAKGVHSRDSCGSSSKADCTMFDVITIHPVKDAIRHAAKRLLTACVKDHCPASGTDGIFDYARLALLCHMPVGDLESLLKSVLEELGIPSKRCHEAGNSVTLGSPLNCIGLEFDAVIAILVVPQASSNKDSKNMYHLARKLCFSRAIVRSFVINVISLAEYPISTANITSNTSRLLESDLD